MVPRSVTSDLKLNLERRLELQSELEQLGRRLDQPVDVVVTHNEINHRHGTGVLVQRLLGPDSRVISIRAHDHYGAEQAIGLTQLRVPATASDRASLYRWALEVMQGLPLGRVLCVPYADSELTVALALHDALRAPLCLYLMDDQNITASGIADPLMAEAVDKARLRLAISSDMRDAYQSKYRRRFWLLPPTLPAGIAPSSRRPQPGRAVIVGNVWGQGWLDALRRTLPGSGLRVDWYANAPGVWLQLDAEQCAAEGLRLKAPLSEAQLAERLGQYEVALLPSAPSLADPQNGAVAALSLPTRIASLLAAAEIPILVLGDPDSCAARFVTHFGLGAAFPYDTEELTGAVARFAQDESRAQLSQAVAHMRERLSIEDLPGWLRASMDAGRPPTDRFEALSVQPPKLVPGYIEDTPRLDPWLGGFEPLHASLRRLAAQGFEPSFVLDVGSSTGVWSDVAARTFRQAQYLLVEPLLSRYDPEAVHGFRQRLPRASYIEAAAGARAGSAELYLDAQLYGSSLMAESLPASSSTVRVPMLALDELAQRHGLSAGGLLKLDVQGAELEAMEGAERLLRELVNVVVVEVSLRPGGEALPSWREIDQRLQSFGFGVWDQAGSWRHPDSGVLLQMDLVYVRREAAFAGGRNGHKDRTG
jgi:FkbM family methyltransferase